MSLRGGVLSSSSAAGGLLSTGASTFSATSVCSGGVGVDFFSRSAISKLPSLDSSNTSSLAEAAGAAAAAASS